MPDLFPNPSPDIVNIKMYGPISRRVNIILSDIQGKSLKDWQFDGNSDNIQMFSIGIKEFASGMYFIKIESEKSSVTKKLIISASL